MSGFRTAYRLVIEGLGISFVTDGRMEQTEASGRVRVRGLLRDGLLIDESCKPEQGRIEVGGFTARIVDRQRDEIICDWLSRQPETITYLASDVGTFDVTLDVQSAEGISEGDIIHLGTEAMRVTGIAGLTLTVQREQWQTIVQGHFEAVGDVLAAQVSVGRMSTLTGRRAFLYRYTSTDDLQGGGTLVWRGVCSTDASLDAKGTTWSITIDSIVSLLKQDLGSDLDSPVLPAGIYYPADNVCVLAIVEHTTAVIGSADSSTVDTARRCVIAMHGFWASQTAWVSDVNLAIAQGMPAGGAGTGGAVAGTSTTGEVRILQQFTAARRAESVVAQVASTGHWEIGYVTGSTPRALIVTAFPIAAFTLEGRAVLSGPPGVSTTTPLVAGAGPMLLRFGEGGVTGQGRAPRGFIGASARVPEDPITWTPIPVLDIPSNVLYVDADISLLTSDVGSVSVEWRDGLEPEDGTYGIENNPSVAGFLALQIGGPARPYYPGTLPQIALRRSYGRGTLNTFVSTLTVFSPEIANRGAMPFISSFELSPAGVLIERIAEGNPALRRRRFVSAASEDLEEYLAHHWRLYGCYPTLTADGRVRSTQLAMPSATSVRLVEIGDADILVDGAPPQWARNRFGSINTVIVKTGWDPIEEEHRGPEYVVRDQQSLATRKLPRTLEIAPRSIDNGAVWTVDLAVQVARPILAMWGRPYSTVTLELKEERIADIRCGTVVGITSARIPNPRTGRRGVADVAGLVVSRRWELDRGRGTITVMVSDDQLPGYAPSAFITGQSLVSGTTYDLTLDLDDQTPAGETMAQDGADISSYFRAGFAVLMARFDVTTTTVEAGEVIGPGAGSTLRVEFASTPTFIGTQYLRYDVHTKPLTDSQRLYAFYADAAARIDTPTASSVAKVFS